MELTLHRQHADRGTHVDLHAWHDCDVRVRPGKPRVLPHGQWHSAEPTCKRVGEIVKYEGLINEKKGYRCHLGATGLPFFFERESVGFSGSGLTEVRLCPKNIRFPTKTLGLLATDPS